MISSLARVPMLHRAADLARVVRVSLRTGMARGFLTTPALVSWTLRDGLNLRTLHSIRASAHPKRPCIVDAHRCLTWRQTDEAVNRLANALLQRFPGTTRAPVAIAMENRAEYLLAWFAQMRLGAPCVHAGHSATADELEFLLQHSGARLVLASASCEPVACAVRDRRPDLGLVVASADAPSLPGTLSWGELTRGASVDHPPSPRAGLLHATGSENVVYTSGTTGRPKGTVRDFARYGLRQLSCILERLPMTDGAPHLVVAPLHHSSAQVFALLATALGSTVYVRPRFDPLDALEQLDRHRIQSVAMVPTMIRRVLDLPREVHARHPLPELRALVSCAAPFPIPLRERAIARFGASAVHDFYGATELGWVTLIDGTEMRRHPGSVGRPLPDQEVRIVDDEGRDVPPGCAGRVYVRSGQLMSGYLRDNAATRESSLGGWRTVDDLGRVDADGHLYIVGRARDMIITGGVNVYPAEVESVLLQHPSVRDVAVLGVPDEQWGERVVAAVVPAGAFDPAEIEAFARAKMSAAKVPRRWETVDELPRNETGKVLKRVLRERFSMGQEGSIR